MRKLKVGIIGLGVGAQHIAGYQGHPACEVTHLCDFSEAALHAAGQKYPQVQLRANADDLLTDPALDIISIASYDNYHYEQIGKALQHNKHVFVEKPLVLHLHEAQHIRALLRERPHLRLSSNLIMRRYPRFVGIKRRIEAGELGRLFHVEADYNYGRLHKIVDGWRGQIDHYSVILGGAVHVIDLLLWLSGERVVEVAAFGNRIASEGTGFRYNDMVVGILQFESGLVGKVTANFGCVFPHFHAVSIYGTRATFINGFDHALLYQSRDRAVPPQKLTEPYPGVSKGDLIYRFVDSIAHDTEPEISVEAVMDTMSVCFALEQAIDCQSKVEVVYI